MGSVYSQFYFAGVSLQVYLQTRDDVCIYAEGKIRMATIRNLFFIRKLTVKTKSKSIDRRATSNKTRCHRKLAAYRVYRMHLPIQADEPSYQLLSRD